MLTCCTCGCAPTVCWTKGFVAFLPVLCSSACSGFASYCGFSSPIWFITFAMASPLRGRSYFVLDRNEGLTCFLFPFWAVSSCCHCPSGFSHHMGQVLVGSHLCTTDGCRWCFALSPSGWASNLCLRLLLAPCHYWSVSWWSSLRTRVFGCSSLSHVMVTCHVRLHDTCSRSKVVLGALP